MNAPEPVFLSVETAVPCGLILNELVTNSLKHAFPNGARGSIEIGVRRDGDRVSIAVADDGRGADIDELQRSESLGLRLVKTLVRQLDATLTIAAPAGLSFTITFDQPHGQSHSDR